MYYQSLLFLYGKNNCLGLNIKKVSCSTVKKNIEKRINDFKKYKWYYYKYTNLNLI
jgi:hypothetical protein